MSKVSIDRELLERLLLGWTQSTDVFGPMQELRAAMAQPAPAQDEREAFEAYAKRRFPLADRRDSLGAYSHGLRKTAREAWEAALEFAAIRPAQAEQQPVAEIVTCEPYEDGSTNPHNGVNWFGRNAENDLPAGTKLYAAPIAQTAPVNQATDGGRNPLYEGLFEGETEQQRTERLASAQTTPQPEQSGWISVTDKLPELDVPVWLHHGDGAIILGERASSTDGWMWGTSYGLYFNGGHWTAVECNPDGDIEPAHWMPLPAAPASGDAA